MKSKQLHKLCISCQMPAHLPDIDYAEAIAATVRQNRPNLSDRIVNAVTLLLVPADKKTANGQRLCLNCLGLICNVAPVTVKRKRKIYGNSQSRPQHFWCGTCDVMQYNWPSSKSFRVSVRSPGMYECRACNAAHARAKTTLKKLFKLVNPLAVNAINDFVGYHIETRVCHVTACRELTQVFDHRTGTPWCLNHFKVVDASISRPIAQQTPGLAELADAASNYQEPIECPDIFSPYPLSVDPACVLGELDNLFTTSWDLFCDFKS
jgi:hypothetical protein